MDRDNSRYSEMKAKYIPQVPPLKRVLKRSNFLSYFFIHRPKIVKWNNQSDLIVFKYLGLKISIAEDFKSRLDNKFLKLLSKLKNHIDILIKSGWKMPFISIYEYNILISFKKFYDRFYQVFKSDELNKMDFLSLERTFVALTYRESYLDTLFRIFEKYLITYNTLYENNNEKYDKLFSNLKLLFQKSSLPHSLRELILAYNVTELNAYYRWAELFHPITSDIVQNEWYNCDREVFNEIVGYYKTIKSSLKSLKVEKQTLLRLQSNCIINQSDSPPILVKFYESHNHNWDIDKSNYFLMFLLVIKGLVTHLENFILRKWELIDDNENFVSQRLITDETLPALYRKLKRESDMAFVYLNEDSASGVNIEDFRASDNLESLINSEQQKKMLTSFEDILNVIYDISNLILSYRDIAAESGYSSNSYLKFMLDSPSHWAGKPVFSLFNYYIELLWTTCAFFRHETFDNLDERLIEIDNETAALTNEIERIDTFNLIDGENGKQ